MVVKHYLCFYCRSWERLSKGSRDKQVSISVKPGEFPRGSGSVKICVWETLALWCRFRLLLPVGPLHRHQEIVIFTRRSFSGYLSLKSMWIASPPPTLISVMGGLKFLDQKAKVPWHTKVTHSSGVYSWHVWTVNGIYAVTAFPSKDIHCIWRKGNQKQPFHCEFVARIGAPQTEFM